MNDVSIIINGVRYDAVDMGSSAVCRYNCDLDKWCDAFDFEFTCGILNDTNTIFKKSDKMFER